MYFDSGGAADHFFISLHGSEFVEKEKGEPEWGFARSGNEDHTFTHRGRKCFGWGPVDGERCASDRERAARAGICPLHEFNHREDFLVWSDMEFGLLGVDGDRSDSSDAESDRGGGG